MSRGKYSPTVYRLPEQEYIYNCYGKTPPEFKKGDAYCEKSHFDNYDSGGYDRYGYSCFDLKGNYLGIGMGVDRNGYTEYDYLAMSDQEWEWL